MDFFAAETFWAEDVDLTLAPLTKAPGQTLKAGRMARGLSIHSCRLAESTRHTEVGAKPRGVKDGRSLAGVIE